MIRKHNLPLIAGLSASLALGLGPARAASPAEMGGWGQAWGEEEVVPPPPPARTPVPAAAPPIAVPAGAAAPLPAGPTARDLADWGDAWGKDQPVTTPPPRRTAAAAPAVMVAATIPATAAPATPDLGGWGAAWGEDNATAAAPPPPPAPVAQAQTTPGRVPAAGDTEEPVQLTADQIIHDRELGIVTAKGRVEIVQTDRSLVADTVSYDLKQDIISASGNVSIMDPTGDLVFADHFELTGDFKDGVAREIRVLLSDNSRLAAVGGQRVGGTRTDFDKAVYTACEPCRTDPTRRPLWEAKAERVTHNQAEKVIEYRDAWIELGGVPVMYTPYLSHPDPSVKRKTGFLVPTPGLSSNLGANVTVPYFWAINDHEDVTFAPRFLFPKSTATDRPDLDKPSRTVLQRVVLAGEHRWLAEKGGTKTQASLTADKNNGDLRGHIDATGRFDLNNVWRTGYQVQRASDETYNTIYGYPIASNRPWLTSRPYIEGFGRKNYAMAEAFAFQGLRNEDDPGQSPVVLPHMMFSHVGTPGPAGGTWSFDSDLLAYGRSEGADATRLSTQAAWTRPFMGRLGDITTLTASLRGDAYHADQVSTVGSANAGRVVPQVSANWRFPFVRHGETMAQVLEPLAMVAVSPNGGNPAKIPNEDSIGFELDEINVLRPNRMSGLDRVEGGARGAYGLRWSAYPHRAGLVTAQIAQGWRANPDSTYGRDSGFEDTLSDYVGRLDFSPGGNLAFLNRVRLDKDSLEVRRNENTLSVGTPVLRSAVTYMMFERSGEGATAFARQHGVIYSVSSDLSQYWSALASASYNLTDGADPLAWATRLAYSDECFAFVTNFRRTFTNDRDALSGYELTFNIVFKTLGDVPFSVF